MELNKIIQGNALQILKTFPADSIDSVVTSPPYWNLRDYNMKGQLGNEPTFYAYLESLLSIFDEVKRVLKPTGTCWVNLGDTYGTSSGSGIRKNKQATNRGTQFNKGWQERGKSGVKGLEKSLCQIPARFAIEMTNRGWILRNEIIWQKPNCMPQSVKDRFTMDFEKIFFFTKNRKYYFKQQFDLANYDGRKDTIMKGSPKYNTEVMPGRKPHTMAARGHERWQIDSEGNRIRNRRCVWNIATRPFSGAHFATFPERLVETPIKSGCPDGGVVLDPFIGSGTTALVAQRLGKNFIGIELNKKYCEIAEERINFNKLYEKDKNNNRRKIC
ncbi:site-specific DNA-methyltransferase [bacterium]|jgi:site-specific DNA-methyltransferase (adenine-specific)|nr:site-specific DNA-methyltransferase [bacterium]